MQIKAGLVKNVHFLCHTRRCLKIVANTNIFQGGGFEQSLNAGGCLRPAGTCGRRGGAGRVLRGRRTRRDSQPPAPHSQDPPQHPPALCGGGATGGGGAMDCQAGLEKTRFSFLKTQPSGFLGFFLYICPEERVFRVFSVSRIL
jgi:hypothetical protein